jgi:hypothetical protein
MARKTKLPPRNDFGLVQLQVLSHLGTLFAASVVLRRRPAERRPQNPLVGRECRRVHHKRSGTGRTRRGPAASPSVLDPGRRQRPARPHRGGRHGRWQPGTAHGNQRSAGPGGPAGDHIPAEQRACRLLHDGRGSAPPLGGQATYWLLVKTPHSLWLGPKISPAPDGSWRILLRIGEPGSRSTLQLLLVRADAVLTGEWVAHAYQTPKPSPITMPSTGMVGLASVQLRREPQPGNCPTPTPSPRPTTR